MIFNHSSMKGKRICSCSFQDSERGGRKKFWRECNLTPYTQHMNILGAIAQYYVKDDYLQKMSKTFKIREKRGTMTPSPPPHPSKSAHGFLNKQNNVLACTQFTFNLSFFVSISTKQDLSELDLWLRFSGLRPQHSNLKKK